MRPLARSLILLTSALPALGWLIWMTTLEAPPIAALPALTATPSATPSPTPPVFTATLDVTPDRQHVWLGETLVVTLSLTVADGCHYPVLESTLTQSGHNLPAFAHLDPPSATVVGGVSMPFTYTLQAIAPGYVTLDGRLYGEQNCGQGWIWTYVSGTSPSIKISDWPYTARLPAVATP